MKRIPIINVTDLYHPHQDPGDNVDILTPYALPEIDLRAVILDTTDRFRSPYADHEDPFFRDPTGPRDPGYIPMIQLNYLFDRNVPFAVSPFTPMRSPADTMTDIPHFQQTGIQLILDTLENSSEPVEILSFGSTRAIAAAYNRNPELFRRKVSKLHISAGASSSNYLEWNVHLDVHGFVRLLRSDIEIAIYPCATENGPFAYGPHNSYWLLENLNFIRDMEPKLRNYLGYALERTNRVDFLRAVDEPLSEDFMKRVYAKRHNVWETAVWAQVARRSIVRRASGEYRLVPNDEVLSTDQVLPNELRPCTVDINDDGLFDFTFTEQSNLSMYDRGDPYINEAALREALPALYRSFTLGD